MAEETLLQQTGLASAKREIFHESSALPAGEEAQLRKLEALVARFTGLPTRREPVAARARYLAIPQETRTLIVNGWAGQAQFIEAAMEEGLAAFDEVGMLRFALSKLNLLSDASVMERIEPTDVLEISNQDFVQVYRSFSYFALCNYSIMELSSYPWFELYERSSLITKQLIEAAETLFSGKSTRINFDHVPEYTLRELMTDDNSIFTLREKYAVWLVSPVTGESYVLSVKSVKELEELRLSSRETIKFI